MVNIKFNFSCICLNSLAVTRLYSKMTRSIGLFFVLLFIVELQHFLNATRKQFVDPLIMLSEIL